MAYDWMSPELAERYDNLQKLTEAFHLVFDVKDTFSAEGPNDARYACYLAIKDIEKALTYLGGSRPARWDGDGR